MSLIKSISGIRGTIGGNAGDNLSPLDVVKFTAAFGTWAKKNAEDKEFKIVVGRDARISGPMVQTLVMQTLIGLGADVVDLDLATTPTVEVAVEQLKAAGGIIVTASHNPRQWNALKLLNDKGEFLDADNGKEVLELADSDKIQYAQVDEIGTITPMEDFVSLHIKQILDLPYVDVEAIKKANFKVAIDCVNSVGGISIPQLLKALGVENTIELYCEPNGEFPHNPEPLPENLTEISETIKAQSADVGFVVDPDVDRLAIVNEDGSMFGEEYTLVAVADYILGIKGGNTVSNMSSSRALRDVTLSHNGTYTASAVGEVNVVYEMKRTSATIGGEGNGGVILPDLHYGRDALVGIALFLSFMAKSGKKCSEIRASYPEYFISKNKIELTPEIDVDAILEAVEKKYSDENVSTIDGVKIDFAEGWVHLRKSNTEPIIRIYSESKDEKSAEDLAKKIIDDIKAII